MKLNLDDFA